MSDKFIRVWDGENESPIIVNTKYIIFVYIYEYDRKIYVVVTCSNNTQARPKKFEEPFSTKEGALNRMMEIEEELKK